MGKGRSRIFKMDNRAAGYSRWEKRAEGYSTWEKRAQMYSRWEKEENNTPDGRRELNVLQMGEAR
jgi:hypothetical protein